MISNNKSRREIIKLLSIAGFGLLIPSCSSPTKKEEKVIHHLPTKEEEELEKLINELEQKLKTKNVVFLFKSNEEYEKNRINFNQNVPKYPKIIALCKNTLGVQESILYAKAKGLKVSVKSGGHSFENFSSNNNGLVINLSLMNTAELKNEEILVAQPSILLKDLYNIILPKNRIIPVGSCGTVAIAGLTLGGGYGFFSRKHGLTCDSLIEATVVDGNGKIHIAKEGDKLMWALRGGGNGNFGVVTELKYITYPISKYFTRYRFQAYNLSIERTKVLLDNWFNLSKELTDSCFSAFVLNGKTLTILLTNYEKTDSSISKMTSTFTKLMDKTSKKRTRKTQNSMSTYFGTMYPINFKNSSAGFYKDYSTIKGCIDDVLECLLNNKIIFQINTFGGKINSEKFEKLSCYPHRKELFLCELQSYWKNNKQKKNRLIAFEKVQNILTKHGINKQYRNYPNISFKDWEHAYYGENYKKLQSIKLKLDPDNLFDYEQSITLAKKIVK